MDPYNDAENPAWSGWDVLARVLTAPFDSRLQRFAVRWLRARLRKYVSPMPTFIDGNMAPPDWIRTSEELQKVDFSSHAFGKTELNICDPAHDLAAAIETFELSSAEKAGMISAYRKLTGDGQIEDRLVLYRVLHAAKQLERAENKVKQKNISPAERKAGHFASMESRKSLARVMEEFSVTRFLPENKMNWTPRLFFIDLDGVLYKWRMRLPIVTRAGMEAVARLRSHGVSVVPNSRRGIDAVKRCCELYGFPAGVAEFGSVILDVKNNREIPLAGKEALEEIARCLESLRGDEEMLLDPDYRYSIRVMRIEGSKTRGLTKAETAELLERNGCRHLTSLLTAQDTYITAEEVNKGVAVVAIKQILGLESRQTWAIGDSEEDLPMLQACDKGFVVGQASQNVKEKARALGLRVLSRAAQLGFAEAVDEIVSGLKNAAQAPESETWKAPASTHLLDILLSAGDWSTQRQTMTLVFDRKNSGQHTVNVSGSIQLEKAGSRQ